MRIRVVPGVLAVMGAALAAVALALLAGWWAAGATDVAAGGIAHVQQAQDGVVPLGDPSPDPSPEPSPDPSPEPEFTPGDPIQPPDFPTETPEPDPTEPAPEPTDEPPPPPAPTATSAGGDVGSGGIAPPDTGAGSSGESSKVPLAALGMLAASLALFGAAGLATVRSR